MLRKANIFVRFLPHFKNISHQPQFFFSNPPTNNEDSTKKPPEYYDPKKNISNNDFLKLELAQNPEFDKAFPFLRSHKKPSTLFPKSEEHDYIDSLSYEKKSTEPKTEWEIYHKNYTRFVEGYRSPSGPMKWMSEEDKEKIHAQIDMKLEELEVTGLSREEILFDDGRKGLPLSQDPFFQLIKKKRLVREMLIKPGETFSVEKVVSLALKQDVGPDPSFSTFEKDMGENDKISKIKRIGGIEKHKRRENLTAEHVNQYYSMNTFPNKEKLKELINKRISYHYQPPNRSRLRRKGLKYVNPLDVHWRNTELLAKFLNTAGRIKTRHQNRIKGIQQRMLAKNIKTARCLMLLPTYSFVRPSDKKSLTTLIEDIEDSNRKAINIETGHLYYKNQDPKDEKFTENFIKNHPRGDIESNEKIKQFKDLEFSYVPFAATKENSEILEAELYARRLKENELVKSGVDVEKIKEEAANIEIQMNPILSKYYEARRQGEAKIDPEKIKESFEKFEKKVQKVSATKVLDLFLAEKTCDPSKLKKLVSESEAYKMPEEAKDSSLEEALKMLSDVKKEIGIESINEDPENDDENLRSVINYKFLNSMKEKEILKDFFTK